ncbi:MAG: hypothetical protein ACPGF8_07370 [Opitutales bacterium]
MQYFQLISRARQWWQQLNSSPLLGCIEIMNTKRWIQIACCLLLACSASTQAAEIKPPPFGAQNRWPIYNCTQCLYMEKYDVHVLGTPSVSEWMMHESLNLVENLIGALRHSEDRQKFAGHRTFLVTDEDPSIPGATLGHRNTGGNGFSMFNEVLACSTAVDTLYPDKPPITRGWNTPVHEFGHAIEFTLGLQQRSDAIYRKNIRNYNHKVAREYFAWSVERWFDSSRSQKTREDMPQWEYDFLASVFDTQNTWIPKATRNKVYEPRTDDYKTPAEADRPAAVEVDWEQIEALVGDYSQAVPSNNWNLGKISVAKRDRKGRPETLKWTNKAGRSWLLYPDLKTGALNTGSDNPYHNSPKGKAFYMAFDRTSGEARVAGFWFKANLFFKQSETELLRD